MPVILIPVAYQLLIAAGVALGSYVALKWILPQVSGEITWIGIINYLKTSILNPVQYIITKIKKALSWLVLEVPNIGLWGYKCLVKINYIAKTKIAAISKTLHIYYDLVIADAFSQIKAIKKYLHGFISEMLANAFNQIDEIRKYLHGYISEMLANAFNQIDEIRKYLHGYLSRMLANAFSQIAEIQKYLHDYIGKHLTNIYFQIDNLKVNLLSYISGEIRVINLEIARIESKMLKGIKLLITEFIAYKVSMVTWQAWFNDFQKGVKEINKITSQKELTDLYNIVSLGLGWLPLEIAKAYGGEIPGIIREIKDVYIKNV